MKKDIDLGIEIKGHALQQKIYQLVLNYTNCKASIISIAVHNNDTEFVYRLYLSSNINNRTFINNIKGFVNGIIALHNSY